MLTQAELESAFKVHFDEMERCEQNKCYWALLHLVVILPDICGALESENGTATKERYEKWCRHLSDPTLTSEEWYEVRCILLHQGRTLAKKGRYRSYAFSQPTPGGGTLHRISETSGGDVILDVGQLKNEMLTAVKKWFRELEGSQESVESKNVQNNMSSLAQSGQPPAELISGLTPTVHQSQIIEVRTTSSLGKSDGII